MLIIGSYENLFIFFRSMRGTIWNRHGAPRNIEIQHISPNPTIAHSNSFGQADQLDSNLGQDSHLGHLDASNTSSEVPSRQSSVSNVRQSFSGNMNFCLESISQKGFCQPPYSLFS